jgi:hypothetical protein
MIRSQSVLLVGTTALAGCGLNDLIAEVFVHSINAPELARRASGEAQCAPAAVHLCLQWRCPTDPIPHPPALWNRVTPGWNNINLTRRDDRCDGGYADSED